MADISVLQVKTLPPECERMSEVISYLTPSIWITHPTGFGVGVGVAVGVATEIGVDGTLVGLGVLGGVDVDFGVDLTIGFVTSSVSLGELAIGEGSNAGIGCILG